MEAQFIKCRVFTHPDLDDDEENEQDESENENENEQESSNENEQESDQPDEDDNDESEENSEGEESEEEDQAQVEKRDDVPVNAAYENEYDDPMLDDLYMMFPNYDKTVINEYYRQYGGDTGAVTNLLIEQQEEIERHNTRAAKANATSSSAPPNQANDKNGKI